MGPNGRKTIALLGVAALASGPLAKADETPRDESWKVYQVNLTERPTVRVKALAQRALSNDPGIRLALDRDATHSRLEALAPDVEEKGEYFTEARGFENPRLEIRTFSFSDIGLPSSPKRFSDIVLPLTDNHYDVPFDRAVSDFIVSLRGDRTVYKCFTPSTCVVSGRVEREIFFERGESRAEELLVTHDVLLTSRDGELVLERRLDDEAQGNFRLRLTAGPASEHLNLGPYSVLFGTGQKADGPSEFVGMGAVIAWHGHPEAAHSQSPSFVAHVFPVAEGLRVRTERMPYFRCTYSGLSGDISYFSLTMPTGSACPQVPWYSLADTSAGQDNKDVREWTFALSGAAN